MEDVNGLIVQAPRVEAALLRCNRSVFLLRERFGSLDEAVTEADYAASVAAQILERMRSSLPNLRRFNRKMWSIQIQSMRDELAKLRKEHGRSACRRRNRLRREIRESQRARRRAMS